MGSFELNSAVGSARLPLSGQNFTGEAIVAGWGATLEGGQIDGTLLSASVEVVAGKHNLFIEEPQQQVANVQAIKIHPNWDAGSMEADICLIELESSFELISAVGSARLPLSGQNFTGEEPQQQVANVQAIKIHPNWDAGSRL